MYIMKRELIFTIIVLFLVSVFSITGFVIANNETNQTNNQGNETNCTENWSCTNWSDCVNENQTRICTDINDCNTTDEKPEESQSCTTGECMENWSCTKWSNCINYTQTRTCTDLNSCGATDEKPKEIKKCKLRLRVGGECPEDCICIGSVTKCWINGERQMTVYAGRSGNIIVQVKGVNMSTKVELYKNENGSIVGVFRNNQTRIIKVLPNGVKEKIRQRIRARLESYNITLDEDGIYQVQTKKRARLFFLIPVREKVRAQINSETGEIIKIRNPWWGFLARDIKENIVGGCGTVTPGLEDECCQNLGYDSWNSEKLECE